MMNIDTGRQIERIEHIKQSIRNILFTRIGTRVMREEYGSLIPDIVDQPLSPVSQMQVMTAIVYALSQWEPRVSITKIDVNPRPSGLQILIYAVVDGQNEVLDI